MDVHFSKFSWQVIFQIFHKTIFFKPTLLPKIWLENLVGYSVIALLDIMSVLVIILRRIHCREVKVLCFHSDIPENIPYFSRYCYHAYK